MRASKEMSAWRPKASVETPKRPRVVTAAARRIDLDSKSEAQRQRLLRQNWQLQGWTYFDSVPELGYAIEFIAHCVGRLRIYVAALSEGGKSDMPIAIDDPMLDAPAEVIEACTNALRDLGNGRIALANVMEALSVNISVTGEAFLLGQEDPSTGIVAWSVRSIEEIVIYNDQVMLREGPMTNQGLLGLVSLDPNYTIVARMWVPHPRFRLLAQSAMRRLANSCEDLMILRRIIRATGRSRLAGRGILLIPAELDIPLLNDDNSSGSADDFISKLTDAMITPIRNEGDASGVVPLVIEGPGETLDKVRWIDFASVFDEQAGKVRAELVQVIATGLDIPAEIISGYGDVSHWTAYQVSTDTFRQHIEPHGITLCDMVTGAFLRPYFAASGLDQDMIDAWIQRIVVWYDATELVTPTDLSASASSAHDKLIISDAAARRYMGFTDEDAPSAEEIEIRMVRTTRNWPPNALIALLHDLDPELTFPAITGPGIIPGLKAGPGGGVDVPVVPAGGAAPVATVTQATPAPSGPALGGPPGPEGMAQRDALIRALRTSLTSQLGYDPFAALTAAAPPSPQPSAASLRLSRQLGQIDRDLMTRLKVAASDAMLEQLRKAAARVIAKVKADPHARARIAMTRKEHVMMVLGQQAVESTGLTAAGLMASDWDGLKEQYYSWTAQAQKAALEKAQRLAGDKAGSTAKAEAAMAAGLGAGWAMLQSSMDAIASHAAYNPNPNVSDEEAVDNLNADTIVPAGVIRAAIAVAGGAAIAAFAHATLANGATVPAIQIAPGPSGIGAGEIVYGYLSNEGLTNPSWTWDHAGSSLHPFEPHLNLDGVDFGSWDAEILANNGDFPSAAFYRPLDHEGCGCQAIPNWVGQSDLDAAEAAL